MKRARSDNSKRYLDAHAHIKARKKVQLRSPQTAVIKAVMQKQNYSFIILEEKT